MSVKKEPRSEVLYVSVRESVKKWIMDNYKLSGYSTMSAFVDALLGKIKEDQDEKTFL